MILIYGNEYVVNEEEWNGERPTDKEMLTTTLDYLDSMQWLFGEGMVGDLPDDWYDSKFWEIREL